MYEKKKLECSVLLYGTNEKGSKTATNQQTRDFTPISLAVGFGSWFSA
jgi:hypothetical protein